MGEELLNSSSAEDSTCLGGNHLDSQLRPTVRMEQLLDMPVVSNVPTYIDAGNMRYRIA